MKLNHRHSDPLKRNEMINGVFTLGQSTLLERSFQNVHTIMKCCMRDDLEEETLSPAPNVTFTQSIKRKIHNETRGTDIGMTIR